jgi:hypothetical protein
LFLEYHSFIGQFSPLDVVPTPVVPTDGPIGSNDAMTGNRGIEIVSHNGTDGAICPRVPRRRRDLSVRHHATARYRAHDTDDPIVKAARSIFRIFSVHTPDKKPPPRIRFTPCP